MRKIILHIATSADGFIARPDGNIDWLTERPAPKGFYGMNAFMKSIDATIVGRKTYDLSLKLGARFEESAPHYVFSRRPAPRRLPPGVHFVSEDVRGFADRLRAAKGKDIWMMGGAEVLGAFLDAGAIDEAFISVVPVFIGEGIPLIAPRHRHVPLRTVSVRKFGDGLVQVHYRVLPKPAPARPRKGRRA